MPSYSLLPDSYTSEFKPNARNRGELVINVSSSSRPSFYRTDFGRPTLYIGDGANSYYTRQIDVLAYALAQFCKRHGFDRVVLTGPSKGGFGALRISTLCATHAPEVIFSNLVFSPQVQIYPVNPCIDFPSYKWLVDKASSDVDYERDLVSFGSLPDQWPANVDVQAYCGQWNRLDADQLTLLPRNFRRVFLPFAGHLSHLPFVVTLTNEDAVRLVIGKATEQASETGDQMSADARETFIRDLLAMSRHHQPTIVDLVNDCFARIDSDMAGVNVLARRFGHIRLISPARQGLSSLRQRRLAAGSAA